MVNCPRCQNRPNECFRSRWHKQVLFLVTLRIRWRCMRCGTTFAEWMWAPEPENAPYRNPSGDEAAESESTCQFDDDDATSDSRREPMTLQ